MASRIGRILEPVFRSLEEKGSEIQDGNHDQGFGNVVLKRQIMEEKPVHVLCCAKMKGFLRSFHLQKKLRTFSEPSHLPILTAAPFLTIFR